MMMTMMMIIIIIIINTIIIIIITIITIIIIRYIKPLVWQPAIATLQGSKYKTLGSSLPDV